VDWSLSLRNTRREIAMDVEKETSSTSDESLPLKPVNPNPPVK
jgi:hypothetical protein